MTRSRLAVAIAWASLALVASSARAHDRSQSHAQVRARPGGALVELRLARLDAQTLPDDLEQLHAHLTSALVVEPCAPVDGTLRELAPTASARRFQWRVRCVAPTAVRLADDLVPASSHLVFVTMRRAERVERHVLSQRAPVARWSGTERPSLLRETARVLPLGAEHLLGGIDHLLFLLLLLVGARRLTEVAMVVTGFTVGHAVTFGLAAASAVRVDVPVVEALIAASIGLVALQLAWRDRPRERSWLPGAAVAGSAGCAVLGGGVAFLGLAVLAACWFAWQVRASSPPGQSSVSWLVAACFGLVHGLGFASAVGDDIRGLGALVGFNLGIELAQLAIVAVAWPAVAWLRSHEHDRSMVAFASTVGVFAAVLFVVQRL